MKIITSDRIAEATVGSFENRSDDAEFPFPFPSFPTTFGSSQAVKQKEGKKMEMTMEQVVLTLASAASVLLLLLAANRWISVCAVHTCTHSLTHWRCVCARQYFKTKKKMEKMEKKDGKENKSFTEYTHTLHKHWLTEMTQKWRAQRMEEKERKGEHRFTLGANSEAKWRPNRGRSLIHSNQSSCPVFLFLFLGKRKVMDDSKDVCVCLLISGDQKKEKWKMKVTTPLAT